MANSNLNNAKEAKKDEFYTQISDIENEVKHYKKHFDYQYMEADHITPWSQGWKTVIENGQMLCRECNRRKSDK